MPPLLLVGGAPRLPIDAIRYLSVAATGATCARLAELIPGPVELLLSVDAQPQLGGAKRYTDREGLDAAIREWLAVHPQSTIFLSAAINDYQVTGVEVRDAAGDWRPQVEGKIPSRQAAVRVLLEPAAKLIEQLPAWGHRGRLVACKYEAATTVLASAAALQRRSGAAWVLANSLGGKVQALVGPQGSEIFASRDDLLRALAVRLVEA